MRRMTVDRTETIFIRMKVIQKGLTVVSTVIAVTVPRDFAKGVAAELENYRLHNPNSESLWRSEFSFDVEVPA